METTQASALLSDSSMTSMPCNLSKREGRLIVQLTGSRCSLSPLLSSSSACQWLRRPRRIKKRRKRRRRRRVLSLRNKNIKREVVPRDLNIKRKDTVRGKNQMTGGIKNNISQQMKNLYGCLDYLGVSRVNKCSLILQTTLQDLLLSIDGGGYELKIRTANLCRSLWMKKR